MIHHDIYIYVCVCVFIAYVLIENQLSKPPNPQPNQSHSASGVLMSYVRFMRLLALSPPPIEHVIRTSSESCEQHKPTTQNIMLG